MEVLRSVYVACGIAVSRGPQVLTAVRARSKQFAAGCLPRAHMALGMATSRSPRLLTANGTRGSVAASSVLGGSDGPTKQLATREHEPGAKTGWPWVTVGARLKRRMAGVFVGAQARKSETVRSEAKPLTAGPVKVLRSAHMAYGITTPRGTQVLTVGVTLDMAASRGAQAACLATTTALPSSF